MIEHKYRNQLILAVFCYAFCLANLVGCQKSQPSNERHLPAQVKATEIEIGIVLQDRPFYHCISFEQIGLDRNAIVTNVESSCECITPKIVQYALNKSEERQAIYLEFQPERSQSKDTEPYNLGVEIRCLLNDGKRFEFIINFLSTELRS